MCMVEFAKSEAIQLRKCIVDIFCMVENKLQLTMATKSEVLEVFGHVCVNKTSSV